ncbi:hypothetical protein WMY93_017733 [Mugilogobius chulae]|uniref:Olfactomedin-like domain-containing protein n=1 Tax=Mugilogobius chulae TaxID=88201 RepID=A0AAW0P0K1_9GOBI
MWRHGPHPEPVFGPRRGSWSGHSGSEGELVPEGEEQGWEEVHAQVSDCEEIVSGIRSVKILKRAGGPRGMWTPDPKSSKVYILNGTSGDTVFRFDSVRDSPTPLDSIAAPQSNSASTGQDLERVSSLLPEPGDDRRHRVDDQGLWLLYASSENEPNINLAKLDRSTMDIEQIWDTGCPRENAEAAFVVCGVVYVVYNTRLPSRSRVQCVFDVNSMVVHEEAPLMYFPRRFGAHTSLKYNPEEKQLYGWDDGYQIIYRLTMKRKIMAGRH